MRNDNLEWDGLAEWWPEERSGLMPGDEQHVWMLAQDTASGVWAHFRDGDDNATSGALLTCDRCTSELRAILADSLPFTHSTNDLTESLRDFTHMVAQTWMLDGDIYFEIRGGWEVTPNGRRLAEARLVCLPEESIRTVWRMAFQIVPKNADGSRDRHMRVLDATRIIRFSPPSKWRGVIRHIRESLRKIGATDEFPGPGFERKQRFQEDFRLVHRQYAIQRAKVTAKIGWNGRGLFSDYCSATHSGMRLLRWEGFCVDLRESILDQINTAFAKIGSWAGQTPRLQYRQMITRQQINDIAKRFEKEDIHPDHLNDLLKANTK